MSGEDLCQIAWAKEAEVVKLDTKGSRKALGAMNAKLRAKIGRLERELAAYQRQSGVVMPNPMVGGRGIDYEAVAYIEGWNACLDEFARLNGAGSHE